MQLSQLLHRSTLTFVTKQHETGDVWSFRFTSSRNFPHQAGQHGIFFMPGLAPWKGIHPYSLSSAPEDSTVMITTHVRAGSAFKQKLAAFKPGDTITMRGPIMDFVFQPGAKDVVFLAQGIGITPYRSMLLHAHTAKLPVKTTLIHVDSGEHVFRAETEPLATESHYPADKEAFASTLNEVMRQHIGSTVYLSGSPGFIGATKKTLRQLGVSSSRMVADSFWGY